MIRPLTAVEKALTKASRREEEKEAVRVAERLKWTDVNSNFTIYLIIIILRLYYFRNHYLLKSIYKYMLS